jgi:hypothetical protein
MGFTTPAQGFYFLFFNLGSVSKIAQLITRNKKQKGVICNSSVIAVCKVRNVG